MSLLSSIGAILLAITLFFLVLFQDELATLGTVTVEPPAVAEQPTELPRLTSTFADDPIPDILLRNATYQQASVIAARSGLSGSTATPAEATVNIFCTETTEENIRTTTGTGFVVSPQGAILTNAHVAQFLLLEESEVGGERTCVVRTGSPATSTYEARLLYVPPLWILNNAALIDATSPIGTGERDYALMYIARRLDNSPLPARFPFLAMSTDEFTLADRGRSLWPAGYPAGHLAASGTASDLLFVAATSTLTDIYTFTEFTPDVLALTETPVSAAGSSGGPVVNEDGQVVGLIVTRGSNPDDNLRALTLSYVERTLREETGFGLSDTVTGDLAWRSSVFGDALAPFLRQFLEAELVE